MKISIIALLLVFFNSCTITAQEEEKLSEKLNETIRKCIDTRIKNLPDNYFDLYSTFLEIESVLLEQKLLKDNSKKSYKILFSEFESNSENMEYKETYTTLNNIFNKKIEKIIWLGSPSIIMAPFECNLMAIEKNKLEKNKLYKDYHYALSKFVMAGTWENWILNNNLLNTISETQFQSITYRASIILILHGYILSNS